MVIDAVRMGLVMPVDMEQYLVRQRRVGVISAPVLCFQPGRGVHGQAAGQAT